MYYTCGSEFIQGCYFDSLGELDLNLEVIQPKPMCVPIVPENDLGQESCCPLLPSLGKKVTQNVQNGLFGPWALTFPKAGLPKSQKIGFFEIFEFSGAQKWPKYQNFKNSYTTFLDISLRMPHANL